MPLVQRAIRSPRLITNVPGIGGASSPTPPAVRPPPPPGRPCPPNLMPPPPRWPPGPELICAGRCRMRRIAQEAQRHGRHVEVRTEPIFRELQRQGEQSQETVAEFAQFALPCEHLFAESRERRRPLIVAKTTQAPNR